MVCKIETTKPIVREFEVPDHYREEFSFLKDFQFCERNRIFPKHLCFDVSQSSIEASQSTCKAPEANIKANGSIGASQSTCKAPETSIEAPQSTCKAPETSIEAPQSTCKAPETSIEANDSIGAPLSTIEAPETSIEANGCIVAPQIKKKATQSNNRNNKENIMKIFVSYSRSNNTKCYNCKSIIPMVINGYLLFV